MLFLKKKRRHAVLYLSFWLLLIIKSAFAAPVPTATITGMPTESFVGEQFCITATFTNTGDTGYGPYYQLILKPDFDLASAQLFGASVNTTLVGTFPGVTTDPISGQSVSGPAGASFYTLEPPVGSVTNGGAPLNTNVCIDIAPGATPGVLQSDAVQVTPAFSYGDSATGGGTPIIGSTASESITPRIIVFTEEDLTAEDETPPGPAFTYDIEAVADIASDRTVSPVDFPRIELTDNRQFVGPIENVGGSSCTATVVNSVGISQSGALPFTPTHMTDPGGYIDISCSSGTGTVGSDRDIIITVPVYAIDNLDINACTYENNVTRNISKHMVVRKLAGIGTVRPGDVVTYTLSFAVSEYAGTENVTITDVMPDGLTFNGITSMSIDGSGIPITPSVSNNTPSGGATTVVYPVSTAYGSTFSPAATGVITYTATVDETYDNGNPIRSNDRITNNALIEYSVVGGAGAPPAYCTDTSDATLNVLPLTIDKSLISTQTEYFPGDTVRFRLRVDIPSGDTQSVTFNDYLPLPALTVGSFSTNTNLTSNPNISLGPNDTLGLTPIAITTNTTSNSFSINWPDVTSSTAEVIEVDIEAVVVTTDPFADNLFLTNIFGLETENTHGETITQFDAVSFTVRAPDLSIQKNVSPSANIDAGDTVNYTINVTNNGGGIAYDVNVRDVLPSGLTGCTISSQPAGAGDLFSLAGYDLSTTLAANGGTASFTYACTLGYDIEISGSHTNTAYVSFASAVGAVPFDERSDTATFSTSPATPTKSIVSTNQTHTPEGTADTNADPRPVSIGERVRYRLATRIPEGTASSAQLVDYLPNGQQYIPGTATVALVSTTGISSTFTCTTGASLNMTGNSSNVTPSCGIDANGTTFNTGTNPVFTIGNLINNDSDADDEYIVIEFEAIVLDSDLRNQQGYRSSNRFRARFNGNYFAYSNRVYIEVDEPQITVAPTVSPSVASDRVSLSLLVSNTGQAKAFQVMGDNSTNWSFTLPSGLKSISNIAINLTGNVYENGTTTPLTVADFIISGSDNQTITLLKPLEMEPSASFNLSFDSDVIPGAMPSVSSSLSVFEYASQVVGDASVEVRTGEDVSAGTGNTPITDNSVANDYRTETVVEVLSISGTVYVDTNSDTLLSGGESGISGVTMVLFDTLSGLCRSTTTNSLGQYQFFAVAPGGYQVIQSANESVPIPNQCPPQPLNPLGYTSTTPNNLSFIVSSTNVMDQNFGELSGPTFEPDHNGQVVPGGVILYAHTFKTPADGTVSFSSSVGGTASSGWSHVLYQDSNCDGALNGTEANSPLSGANLSVSSGGQICTINKVYAPATASAQEHYQVTQQAEFAYSGGGLAIETLQVIDNTITSNGVNSPETGGGSLELRKSVENLTQSTAETDTANQAIPGDVLKYRIYYTNKGTGDITDLQVNDTVPVFTGFILSSQACETTPTTLACTTSANFDELSWEFTGTLEAGDTGYVSYEVMVDN
ncbi:MAG: isopeptide-forming domain-containing fimbrial protein [Thiolinea sp.]